MIQDQLKIQMSSMEEFIDKQNIIAHFGGKVHKIRFNNDYTTFSSIRKNDSQIVNGKLIN